MDTGRTTDESLASAWADAAIRLLRSRDPEIQVPDIRASCRKGLAAIDRHLESGSPSDFDAYLEPLVAARLGTKADIGDVVEEVLSVLPPALSWLQDRASYARFQVAVVAMASRACPMFASRKRRELRRVAIHEERQRLARDLHDHLTQSLYGVGLLAEAAGRRLDREEYESAGARLKRIEQLARETLAEMRIWVFELRPAPFDTDGLAGAIRARLAFVEERAGFDVSFRVEGEARPPLGVERELFGIAVEALNNTLKHARARRVAVVLRQDIDAARLEIEDDGTGFDLALGRAAGGKGLAGMEERSLRIAARLRVESAPGRGTRATVEVPLAAPKTHTDEEEPRHVGVGAHTRSPRG